VTETAAQLVINPLSFSLPEHMVSHNYPADHLAQRQYQPGRLKYKILQPILLTPALLQLLPPFVDATLHLGPVQHLVVTYQMSAAAPLIRLCTLTLL
jgi:hypothetical protein